MTNNRVKKIATTAVAAAVMLIIALAVVPNIILNSYKDKLEENGLKTGNLSYNFFNSTLSAGQLSFHNKDSSFSVAVPQVALNNINIIKLLFGGLSAGKLIIDKPVLTYFSGRDAVNKEKDNSGLTMDSLPGLLYSLLPERLKPLMLSEIDINGLTTVTDNDTSNLTVRLNGITIDTSGAKKNFLIADDIEIYSGRIKHRFTGSRYLIQTDSLYISSAGKKVIIKNFSYSPYVDDLELYRGRKYASTNYKVRTPLIEAQNIDLRGIIKNKVIKGTFLNLSALSLTLQTDKSKEGKPGETKLPHNLAAETTWKFAFDSVKIKNGIIHYAEYYPYSSVRPFLEFASLNIKMKNVNNYANLQNKKPAHAEVSTLFFGKGKMKLIMDYPLYGKRFNIHYEGSLENMDLTEINKFLEVSQRAKIKSGYAQSAFYNVTVKDGFAIGDLTARYNSLKIEFLNNKGEKGLLTGLKSFIANNFKIKRSNPDDSGMEKTGYVSYHKQPNEAFFEYLWIVLRGGLSEIIGF